MLARRNYEDKLFCFLNSTLNPADDQEAGRLDEADEDTYRSYNNAQAGNSRYGLQNHMSSL